MANPSGRKGAAWETAVVRYLSASFPGCERRVSNGRADRGDVTGVPNTVIECKDERSIDLPGYLAELEVEKVNAVADFGVVFVKNRRHGVGAGYAVMTVEDARSLLAYLQQKGLL